MTAAEWRREIHTLCDELGWRIARTNKHIVLNKEGARAVICSASPSCPFALKKVRAEMRRNMKAAGVPYDA